MQSPNGAQAPADRGLCGNPVPRSGDSVGGVAEDPAFRRSRQPFVRDRRVEEEVDPPGVEPAPWRFPARNRIVAGLAQATVVVEARERSGALITADLALEEGRDVFAVPGEIGSTLSAGTNGLLKLGAAPLVEVGYVLAAYGLLPAAVELCERNLAGLRDTIRLQSLAREQAPQARV